MTEDQFWRLVITSAFVGVLSMFAPRIRKWVDSLGRPSDAGGEKNAGRGPEA